MLLDRFRDLIDIFLAHPAHAASPRVHDGMSMGKEHTAVIGVFMRGIRESPSMIRKLRSGQYRLYSRKVHPKTGRRRNLGTFKSRVAAEKHERAVQYFKRH